MIRKLLIAVALTLGISIQAQAAQICVTGASAPVAGGGCSSTVATLQLAITAATFGDTIYLHAGTTYTGHWTLPDKGAGSTYITITGDGYTTGLLPSANVRLDPDKNPALLAALPILVSDSTSNPTFNAAQGSHHWKLQFLKFAATPQGFNEMIRLGSNDCSVTPGRCEEYESQEPTDFLIDQCFLQGDKVFGQKRGVTIGGKRITITNSTIIDINALGQDANAIGGATGHGPYVITNNRLESGTENFMLGGDDPHQTTFMTVSASPAPTTTGATVTVQPGRISTNVHNLSELSVGQLVAILVTTPTGDDRRFTHLRSITGSGTTGSITYDPIDLAPQVPGDIRGGVVASGVTFRNNYLTKPLRWLTAIVDTVPTSTAVYSSAAGSLAAGTYYYSVQAINKDGYNGVDIFSTVSPQISVTTPGTGQVVLTWDPVPTASHYRIYGRATGAPTMYFEVTAPTVTYTDTGSAGTAATSIPKGTFWQIKNLFEIKAAQNVQVDGNIMDYTWSGSDIGFLMWIKSVNQGLRCEFCQSKDIVIEKNLLRHSSGVLSISGSEFSGGTAQDRTAPLTNFTFRNNLAIDSGNQWALSKGGAASVGAFAINAQNWSIGTVIDHNTFIHTARGFVTFAGKAHEAFTISNNMSRRETYGIFGTGTAEGLPTITQYMILPQVNTGVFYNAIAGISTSKYPPTNFGPTVAAWEAEFVNYTPTGADNSSGPADYHLRSDSTYHNAGSDGKDVGADVSAIFTATANVISGSSTAAVPPTITTGSLPGATLSVAYGATLTGSGTGALSWAVTVGSLPVGLSLNGSTGAITGTPTVSNGGTTFTVTVTDAGTALTATKQLSIQVTAAPTTLAISTGTPLPAGVIGTPYSSFIDASGGQGPYTYALTAGTLPAGLVLNPSSAGGGSRSVVTGTPSGAPGTASFTVTATDNLGAVVAKAFGLTITAASVPSGRPTTSGPVPQQVAAWAGPTAPDSGTVGCCNIGDEWTDTSTTPGIKKQLTSLSPLTWVSYSGNQTHTLLSATHTDTVAETVQDSDLIVGNETKWVRLPKGGPGTFLGSDGASVGWQTPTFTLPDTTQITTRLNTPILGVSTYGVFQETNCATVGVSSAGFTRFCMDATSHTMKVSTNGGAYTTIPSAGSAQFLDIAYHTAVGSYTPWGAALASGIVEFITSPRNRVKADLTQYTQARIVFRQSVACNTGASLFIQYSTDETTWTALDGSTGPSALCDATAAGITATSTWATITALGRADVFLRVAAQGGNATVTPSFGAVHLQFK